MAYVYLLDLNKFVTQRLAGAQKEREQTRADSSERCFLEGRTRVLLDFQDFLRTHYIPRLPRRIRETYLKEDN